MVIWGGHDTSLTSTRELATMPVIGPGMVSMHIASMLAERFSLLVQLHHIVDIERLQVRDIGLERRCVGIYPVSVPVLDLGKPESFGRVLETAISSIEESGADAVCLGCMAMNDYIDPLVERLSGSHPDVVVVHPGKAAIGMVELIVGMGLSHSKKNYHYPPKRVGFKF